MRRWSHEERSKEIFAGGAGARGANGVEHTAEYPSRWAAECSVAAKIGCSAATLNEGVKRWEIDRGSGAGVPIGSRSCCITCSFTRRGCGPAGT